MEGDELPGNEGNNNVKRQVRVAQPPSCQSGEANGSQQGIEQAKVRVQKSCPGETNGDRREKERDKVEDAQDGAVALAPGHKDTQQYTDRRLNNPAQNH